MLILQKTCLVLKFFIIACSRFLRALMKNFLFSTTVFIAFIMVMGSADIVSLQDLVGAMRTRSALKSIAFLTFLLSFLECMNDYLSGCSFNKETSTIETKRRF